MNDFLEQAVLDYGETRDFPAIAGTSVLSPYLAAGIISPRQCVAALQQRLGYRPQSKAQPGFVWLNELIWREFYRHLLVLIPTLSMNRPFKPETAALPWSWDRMPSPPGARDAPATPSSMRRCAASTPPAGCTTGCG